ncbi:Ribosomal RNA-processing protein 7 [Pichia californica]|uniref:Ribosomal RNA-processing protein 7 n=1 Tax=Pichia californica TaxID=460514 RepID=A0A9P7BF89_9ASCO|nr:Ribosomal RNA-processing protein 7 [[Candida] californica]KAG0690272.1 Ribosomal RNA-processing protein 7 [[Candida] californica]
MSAELTPIKGFLPLPITIPAIANLAESTHICYIKPHLSKDENEQINTTRSLFLINPLPFWTIENVKKLFNQVNSASHIEKILLRESIDTSRVSSIGSGVNYDLHINLSKLTNIDFGFELNENEKLPFGSSVITFLDRDGFELFLSSLKKIKKNLKWDIGNSINETGFNKYSKIPNVIIDRTKLEKEITNSLVEFQQREKNAEEEVQNMKEIVDEDGFTLVVGSQKKTKSEILGSIKKLSDLEKDDSHVKKMEKKEKKDFYRFQIRERKKQEMNQLLSKFKEDQERVKLMKQRRRFRPY